MDKVRNMIYAVIILAIATIICIIMGIWYTIDDTINNSINKPYYWDESEKLTDDEQFYALTYDSLFRLRNQILEIDEDKRKEHKHV